MSNSNLRGGISPGKSLSKTYLEELCRERTPEAIRTILWIMIEADRDSTRLDAAKFIIERGWGKASQSLELTGASGGPLEIKIVKEIVDNQTTDTPRI